LWRIKEEPYLWRRYWNDGRVLFRLLFTHVLPFAFWTWWLRLRYERRGEDLIITQSNGHDSVTVSLAGHANAWNVDKAIHAFRTAIETKKRITLDFSNTLTIDTRFLGLILMLKKKLKSGGATITFVGLSPGLQRIFRLNRLEFDPLTNASGAARSVGKELVVDATQQRKRPKRGGPIGRHRYL
jgi:N-acetylglucosaminyldiphosphoundecaprenol N-acetyl-beta-D-mannosaminyltransferase